MNIKTLAKIACYLVLLTIIITNTYGERLPCDDANTCCNKQRCENPKRDLIFHDFRRWERTGSHSTIHLYFKVNLYKVDSNMPNLERDVVAASRQWSQIRFYDKTVGITIHYQGTINNTTNYPGRKDSENVVGWAHTMNSPAETTVMRHPITNIIYEADIGFDYYMSDKLRPHVTPADFPTDKHCILNVATHEFGHFIGLEHVTDVEVSHCPQYLSYTMYAPGKTNYDIHWMESLTCQDKWAAWYLYNRYNTPNAPSRPTESPAINSEDSLETKLLQNYPDPFNPDTWIPYQLAKEADVTIEIYDEQGHLVRTLSIGKKPKGQYINRNRAAYWDGKNEQGESLPSGLYFYHLKAGDVTSTRRMVIVK